MNNDRLHGFAFRSPQVAANAHTCPTLFADSKVIHILTEIAKDHADMFIWFCFSHMDEDAVSKGFAREQMTLFYDDKSGKNGGMEISFSLWQGDRLEIEMTAMTGHETGNDDDGECFNQDWDITLYDKTWIELLTAPAILNYLGIYMNGGVNAQILYQDEIDECQRVQEAQEKQLLDEIVPLVLNDLSDDDKECLIKYPDAGHHHFDLGLHIRNKYLWSRAEIEPDSISQKILERIITQLIPSTEEDRADD